MQAKGDGQRIPAVALESLVIRRIRGWLADPAALLGAFQHDTSDSAMQKRLIERAKHLSTTRDNLGTESIPTFVRASVVRIQIHADRIDVTLDQDRVCRWLDGTSDQVEAIANKALNVDRHPIILGIPARLRRAGKEMKIIADDGSDPAIADTGLVRLLIRAGIIRDRLLADRSMTLEEIAKGEGVVPSYATRLFRLTLLAPDIVSAILGGRHPPELTARKLMDDTRLPLDWNEQRRRLGFEPAP